MYKELRLSKVKINRIYTVVQNTCLKFPVILAGGAVRDITHDTAPADYDIFFTDLSKVGKVRDYLQCNGFEEVFACPAGELFTYVKTYDPLVGNRKIEIKVQLVCKREYFSVADLLDSFDFNACVFALDIHYDTVITTKNALKDVTTKVLSINNITYPSSSINRLYKYRNKGYYVGKAIQEIVQTINQMYPEELNDDTLYID